MRLMPAKYAAALFDLDNTLWDRSAAILATGRLLHQTDPAVRATASAEDAAASSQRSMTTATPGETG